MLGGQRKSYTVDEARRRIEHYCSYQERCHKEVVKKLKEMGMIPQAIDTIVVHLIKEGFLSEERYSMEFARGKFSQKRWGKTRITRELKQRGITDYLIKKALLKIDRATYLETFKTLAESRWEQLREEGDLEKKKRKLADYLLYRGWESDLVYTKVIQLAGSIP